MGSSTMTPEQFAQQFSTGAPEMITGYLIDVYNETASVITIPKTLDSYHSVLDCRCIDIVDRQIGARCMSNLNPRRFDIICDDEALNRNPAKISAIDNMGTPMLCGNLLIVKNDGVGGETSIDEQDIKYLLRFIIRQGTHRFPRPYFMLHQCEW